MSTTHTTWTITDEAGDGGTITGDAYTVCAAIRAWFPEAPEGIRDAVEQLAGIIEQDTHTPEVPELAAALGLGVSLSRTRIAYTTRGAVEHDISDGHETIVRAWKWLRGEHGRWLAAPADVVDGGFARIGGDTVDITEVINHPDARPGGRPTLVERLRSIQAEVE